MMEYTCKRCGGPQPRDMRKSCDCLERKAAIETQDSASVPVYRGTRLPPAVQASQPSARPALAGAILNFVDPTMLASAKLELGSGHNMLTILQSRGKVGIILVINHYSGPTFQVNYVSSGVITKDMGVTLDLPAGLKYDKYEMIILNGGKLT